MKQGNSESDQTPDFYVFEKYIIAKDNPPNFVCFREKKIGFSRKNRIFEKNNRILEKSGFRFPRNVS